MSRPDPALPNTPHPEPERLALAALPAEPQDPAVVAHLRGCERCRAELADLRRTVELAKAGGMGDPLPAPPPRVWQAIAAELGLPDGQNGQVDGTVARHVGEPHAPDSGSGDADDEPAATDTAPAAAPSPGRSAGRRHVRRPGRRRRVLVPLVAAVLCLLAGIGIGRALAPDPPPGPVVEAVSSLAPVSELDPAASGTVTMADESGERRMIVQVQGVTNLAGGDHLEAWLMDATGTRLVPLGALAGGDGEFRGTFAVPDGLPLGEFGRVDVSAERWDGDPGHSARSLVRGTL